MPVLVKYRIRAYPRYHTVSVELSCGFELLFVRCAVVRECVRVLVCNFIRGVQTLNCIRKEGRSDIFPEQP